LTSEEAYALTLAEQDQFELEPDGNLPEATDDPVVRAGVRSQRWRGVPRLTVTMLRS